MERVTSVSKKKAKKAKKGVAKVENTSSTTPSLNDGLPKLSATVGCTAKQRKHQHNLTNKQTTTEVTIKQPASSKTDTSLLEETVEKTDASLKKQTSDKAEATITEQTSGNAEAGPVKQTIAKPDAIPEDQASASIIPSAPLGSEQCGIYPDLTSYVPMSAEIQPTEIQVAEMPILRPRELTKAERESLFYAHSIDAVAGIERLFISRHINSGRILPFNGEGQWLYDHLKEYGRLSHMLMGSFVELRKVTQLKLTNIEDEMWSFKENTYEGNGKCADDRNISATHSSKIAVLDEPNGQLALDLISKTLDNEIKEEKYYTMQRHYLHCMLTDFYSEKCADLANVEISTLHSFLSVTAHVLRQEANNSNCKRRPDCQFKQDLYRWVKYVAGRLVTLGNNEDRLQVVHHVLRFPGGIAWAKELIHPLSPSMYSRMEANPCTLDDETLRVVLFMANVILQPISDRNTFMRAGGPEGEEDTSFTWVDTDGEGDGDELSKEKMVHPLTEEDMLALLEQLPFRAVFETMTTRMNQGGAFQMLSGLVFADALVSALCNGCYTYGHTARYTNLIKRLGLLITHTIYFVSNALSENLPLVEPAQQRENVQHEYDMFVYRAVTRIYHAQAAGLRQYMLTLPFAQLSMRAVWWLYSGLRTAQFTERPLLSDDQDAHSTLYNTEVVHSVLLDLSQHEFYYTLQMLVTMAVARDWKKDHQFIDVIAGNLLQLLTVVDSNESIKQQYLMDQLRELVTRHPPTISRLLNMLDSFKKSSRPPFNQSLSTLKTAENLLKVFNHKYLPLRTWSTTESDINILLTWFETSPNNSTINKIATNLLTHIYYGRKGDALAVPRQLQIVILRRVVREYRRQQPLITPERGSVEYRENQDLQRKCLVILQQLRVHAMDQCTPDVQRVMKCPADGLNEAYVEHFCESDLSTGTAEGCYVSCFAALLCTTAGHWIPVICQDGLTLLDSLLLMGDDGMVVRCLELIVPLFADCQNSLLDNVKFRTLINKLLMMKRTTGGTENDPPSKEPEDNRLEAMMVTQIHQYRRYGFASPAILIKFWTKCVTRSAADFTTNEVALRVLNRLAYIALGFADAWHTMRMQMIPYFQDLRMIKPSKSCIKKIIKIFSDEPISLYTNLPSEYVALALMVFEVEHQQVEVCTGLWVEVIHLLNNKPDITLDDAMQEACDTLKHEYCPPASMLVLYKQARLLAQAKANDILYPLLCQRFFSFLLTRIPAAGDDRRNTDMFGVAQRMYAYDATLMSEVKKSLGMAHLFYSIRWKELHTAEPDTATINLYSRISGMLDACVTWLNDLHGLDRASPDDVLDLPARYCVQRLATVVLNKQEYWLDLVNDKEINATTNTIIQSWYRVCRHQSQRPLNDDLSPSAGTSLVPGEKANLSIERLLKDYNSPVPLPTLGMLDSVQFHMEWEHDSISRTERMLIALRAIENYTDRRYNPTLLEFNRLKTEIVKKTKLLYNNKEETIRTHARCNWICTGEGNIQIRIVSAKRNENIFQRLEDYRRDLASTVEAAIYLPPVIMDQLVLVKLMWMNLFKELTDMNSDSVKRIKIMKELLHLLRWILRHGRDDSFADHLLFILNNVMQHYMEFLPDMLFDTISDLIVQKQCPKPSTLLFELLDANKMPSTQLLNIYRVLSTSSERGDRLMFMELFGQKFDMTQWLLWAKPGVTFVNQLHQIICDVLRIEQRFPNDPSESELKKTFLQLFVPQMIAIATYDFPVNFSSVLLNMLRCTAKPSALPPTMILELLNSLRVRLGLLPMHFGMSDVAQRKAHCDLALANVSQPVPLISMGVTDMLVNMVSIHFKLQCELSPSVNTLYEVHEQNVEALSLLFGALAHVQLQQKIVVIPFLPHVTLPNTLKMFEVWLTPRTIITPAGPEVRQPCTEQYIDSFGHMIRTLVQIVDFAIANVEITRPGTEGVSNVLFQIFIWYIHNYVSEPVMGALHIDVHKYLLWLPWEKMQPSNALVACFTNGVWQISPAAHQFLCLVFVRCEWIGKNDNWLDETPEQSGIARNMLLMLCVKLSLGPTARNVSQAAMVQVLKNITTLPWRALNDSELAPTIDLYINAAEPSAVLRSPTCPNRQLDGAVLDLLEIASGCRTNERNPLLIGEDEMCKRLRFIHTVVHHIVLVSRVTKKTAAVTNVKQQVSDATVSVIAMVVKLLKDMPVETSAKCQQIEARNILTAIIRGIRSTDLMLEPFFVELNKLLRESSLALPLSQSVLQTTNLFFKYPTPLMTIIEMALSYYIASQKTFAVNTDQEQESSADQDDPWMEALEMIASRAVICWSPDVLAREGHVLCLQLYILHQWHKPLGTMFKIKLVRELITLLQAVKKETDDFNLYPLWMTMVCALLTLTSIERAQVGEIVKSFVAYLSMIGEQSPPSWLFGIVKSILQQKSPSPSRRIIALGLAYCLSTAYRTLTPNNRECDKDADGDTESAAYVTSTNMISETKQAIHRLMNDQGMAEHHEQIVEVLGELPSQLDFKEMLQFALNIIAQFDNRASHIVRTLIQALHVN